MRDVRNNSGIVAGGNVTGSSVKHVYHGPVNTTTDEERLEEINDLLAELLQGVRQLPAQERTAVRSEVVELQAELDEPAHDKEKINGRLGRLRSAFSAAAPLIEIVKDIAELVANLVH
jgi:hypothetical protein